MADKESYSAYRWYVLFTACFAISTLFIHMTAIPALLSVIAQDMQIDMGTASQFMTGWMLAISVATLFLGVVCDKKGLSFALNCGLLTSLVSVLLIPLVGHTFWPFFTLRLLQGMSVGFIMPVIGFIAVKWFPAREHGLINGIFFGVMSLGSSVGVALTPVIMRAVDDWQLTLVYLGAFNVIGIILALSIAKSRPPVQDAITTRAEPMKEEMSFKGAVSFIISWVGPLVIFANAWVFFGLYNFVPTFLSEPAPMGIGLGPITSGYLCLSLTVIGIVSGLIGGFIYDRVFKGHAKPHIALGFVIAAFALLLILPSVRGSVFLIAVILMLSGFAIPFQNPAVSSYIIGTYPAGVAGRMMGWWFGIGDFGAVAGLFFGSLSISHSGSYNGVLVMITMASIIGLAITLVFLKHGLRVYKQEVSSQNEPVVPPVA